MTIGRYLPLNSWMHKRDPRIKLISMIILIVAVFIDIGFLGYGIIGAFLIVALLVSKVSFKMILKSMRAMLFMMVFLLIINTFVVKTGALWINFGLI